MNLKFILTAILMICLCFPLPVVAETIPAKETSSPNQTYFLIALPHGSRQSVKLDPPATRLVISSHSGDTSVRCGEGIRSYTCSPGKRLELTAENSSPIKQIWAENSHETQVRLKIEVLETLNASEDLAMLMCK